jgi:hypothetical protein
VASIESFSKELNNNFSAKVILLNHEKDISVDNQCSNIAIKYNMLYISTYQLIGHHIQNKTKWGMKLQASKKAKTMVGKFHDRDQHEELEYSPVHYDFNLVMQLLRETITLKATNQKFVLLEGLCNSNKLEEVDDQL